MSGSRHDIVIAGGGMVGVSLALCLQRQLGKAYSVLLIEGYPLPARDPSFQQNYSPSFDARSTALSYSSYLIYRQMGVWPALEPRACAIETVHVSEQGRFGSTRMLAAEYDWPALGYVVENAWLGNSLLQALLQTGIETLSPEKVVSAVVETDGVVIGLESGDSVNAGLLVVADGANSILREALGIEVVAQDYKQHALIANIAHAGDHEGCAWERFTAQGPLALLPLLPDPSSGNRSALVWSLPQEEAQRLQHCPQQEFLSLLQERFGYRLGRLLKVGERHSYPLSLIEAREQVRQSVVIMGNAAHSLHPVAGQGFNLALRDIACLCSVLKEAIAAGESIGELAVLQRYLQQQSGDQQRTTAFSDRLPDFFMQRDPALALLRDVGLFALDLSPALKREFVRHTAGVAASKGYRDVQA
jgi:2-octaprenyl-6-methoxyphenol hydroxylase